MKQKLEYVEKDEKLYDYVLMEYEPIIKTSVKSLFRTILSKNKGKNTPFDLSNKLRISNIFFKSIENTLLEEKWISLIEELRNEIGLNQTVWGIKNVNGKVSKELYFYNHLQPDKIKFSNIVDVIGRILPVNKINFDEASPHMMFSFDIEETAHVKDAHVYFGKFFNESFHSWSYKLSSENKEFENHYEFFIPQDFPKLSEKILSSPFFNSKFEISKILIPDYMSCKSICVATKRTRNGIYYQGINVKQFILFLKQFKYPIELINFVEINQKKFDYILFDVGFDYTVLDNELVINKSGFYGTF